MSIDIKKIGSYLHTKNGFLVDDFKESKLQDKWISASRDAVDIITKNVDVVVSIYLRGSIANGSAIENISDVDLFVILIKDIDKALKTDIYNKCNDLINKYSFVTRFDIGFRVKEKFLVSKDLVLIKLRAYKIFGEDLLDKNLSLKPGKDIFVHLTNIEDELNKLKVDLNDGVYNSSNVAATCRWIAKRIIRSGLEMVSEREQVYTRDLYKCWEAFSKYYSEHSDKMYQVLFLAINPTSSIFDLKDITDFGLNLVSIAKRDNCTI